MKKFSTYSAVTFSLFLFFCTGSVFALSLSADLIGKTLTTKSDDGRYSLERKILRNERTRAVFNGAGDVSTQCTFKDGSEVVWTKEIPAFPAKIDISNNGEIIVVANCEQESSAKSVSFYNRKGELIKELYFDKDKFDNRKSALDKIKKEPAKYGYFLIPPLVICNAECGVVDVLNTTISPDGGYYALAGWYDRDKMKLFFYDIKSTSLLWAKEFNLIRIQTIKISPDNNFILVASYDPKSTFPHNMAFFLLDLKGSVKWEKQIQGYTDNDDIDYASFIDNGKSFKIFSGAEWKYLFFEIDKDGTVSEKIGIVHEP